MMEALLDSPLYGICVNGEVRNNLMSYIVKEKKCRLCGRHFCMTVSPDEWGWGYGRTILFCSYRCMMEYKRTKGMRNNVVGIKGRPSTNVIWQDSRELTIRRAEECLGKIVQIENRLNEVTDKKERRRLQYKLTEWRSKLEEASSWMVTRGWKEEANDGH